jgi:hypothetical protein
VRVGEIRTVASYSTAKGDSVQPRHVPIGEDDVDPLGLVHLPSFQTVASDRAGVTQRANSRLEPLTAVGVVLCDENFQPLPSGRSDEVRLCHGKRPCLASPCPQSKTRSPPLAAVDPGRTALSKLVASAQLDLSCPRRRGTSTSSPPNRREVRRPTQGEGIELPLGFR